MEVPRYADDSCSICLEPYEIGKENKCLALKCGHLYHLECISGFFKGQSRSTCPLCRARVKILIQERLNELSVSGSLYQGINKTLKFFFALFMTYGFFSYKIWLEHYTQKITYAGSTIEKINPHEVMETIFLLGFFAFISFTAYHLLKSQRALRYVPQEITYIPSTHP